MWRVGRGAGEEELAATGGDSCNWDLDLPRFVNSQHPK